MGYHLVHSQTLKDKKILSKTKRGVLYLLIQNWRCKSPSSYSILSKSRSALNWYWVQVWFGFLMGEWVILASYEFQLQIQTQLCFLVREGRVYQGEGEWEWEWQWKLMELEFTITWNLNFINSSSTWHFKLQNSMSSSAIVDFINKIRWLQTRVTCRTRVS